MKARKVNYDEFSGAFTIETRLEALRRQVLTHAQLVNVLNRSQEAKLRFTSKKNQQAIDIVCRRLDKEGQYYKKTLKERLAYLEILRDFAQRETHSDDITYADLYDLGLSRKELKEMIEEKVKESTPSAKRQKLCQHILNTRRLVKVFDRTKSTSALLKMKDSIVSRPVTEQQVVIEKPTAVSSYSPRVRAARLILPPISVSWSEEKTKSRVRRKGQHELRSSPFFLTNEPAADCPNSASKLPELH
ncbi:hypothetical protein Bpfe_006347 [Biomphalaria pfeifferi]|uniref:Uncharacterized protein n=1 Tax=Biomphalaria pfeifferi TaxID=112525 RepID=A0AAD8C1R0_BIOPF|nr:hypothetical protein Bpfe_006347 [Biomphalaria pfeifferi]